MRRAATHTPGPWQVRRGFGCDVVRVDGFLLASAYPPGLTPDGYTDATTIPEAEANARLIAAAPELLDISLEALLIAGAFGAGRLIDPEILANWSRTIPIIRAKVRGEP